MIERIGLEALDGGRIGGCLARPAGRPLGGIVLVQEIFGVNPHIRAVAEDFAAEGWLTLAPAFFDRVEADLELDYSPEGFARGRAIAGELGFDAPLRDVHAAAAFLRAELSEDAPLGVVGYCWGGTVAFLATTRLGLAGVGYYGARTPLYLHERPQAPLLLHFGERDASIPAEAVARIEAALPTVPCHRYPAGHGFNRLGHPDGDAACAALAKARTLAFLAASGRPA
jgi:carboxymethylenebutenolidase